MMDRRFAQGGAPRAGARTRDLRERLRRAGARRHRGPASQGPPSPATPAGSPPCQPPAAGSPPCQPPAAGSSPFQPPAADSTGAQAALLDEAILDSTEGLPRLEVNLGPTTDSNLYVGMSGDVARGGVFAATYERLALGSQVDLHITFAGGFETRALGVVRFVSDGLDDMGGATPGLGIKFVALSDAGYDLVRRFAGHREPALLSE